MAGRFTRRNKSGESWLTSYADLITNLLIFFLILVTASQIQSGKMAKILSSIQDKPQSESLPAAEKKIKETLKRLGMQDDVAVDLTDQGLEIRIDSAITFDSGEDRILPEIEEKINEVLGLLQPYAKKYHIAIEGHTDSNPIFSDRFKSNWHLSSARALMVREKLAQIGVEQSRIRIEAYADTRPLPVDTALNLPQEEVDAKNRRVVVRLY